MRFVLVFVTILSVGCSEPSVTPGPKHEWFIFVGSELSEAVHQRFADELPTFAGEFALPGEVIHIIESPGLLSFTVRLPADGKLVASEAERELQAAAENFTSSTHLEGCDECRLRIDSIEYQMKTLRATDLPTRVLLLGSERPLHYIDFGCECENAPHSLLKEYFAKRFHPEFKVPLRSEIDFKLKYGW